MTDQPRDQVNRYARLGPAVQTLIDDYDQIALALMYATTKEHLDRAEAELRQHAENESADAAAGSYAGRAERVEKQRDQLAALVRDFLDPDPCQLDHHGYCQAHSWLCSGSTCPHARAREALAALDTEDHAIADPARWLHIEFTSPDETTANTSALTLRDHLGAEFDGVSMRITSNAVEVGTHDARTTPAATEATGTWKEPTHPNPCTATIEGRATPGGRRVKCTREARHPENHVGPKLGANGRVLWTDHQPGATPHKEQQP